MSDRPLMPRGSTEHGEAPPLEASVRAIERAAGALATASVARMDETLPWFRELPADQRAWVMLVAQAGVRSLVEWLRRRGETGNGGLQESDEVFDAAPRALARSLKLEQTVQLIRITIDVVAQQVGRLAAPGEAVAIREAVLQFSREVAFAAARVYARAAETRGAWDARLQALLVDALLRGDSSDVLASRAAALGWGDAPPVAVAVGRSPGGETSAVLHTVYRAARRMGVEILGGVHGDRLVVVLGGAPDPLAAAERLLVGFGDGPVVVGPAVPSLDEATESARGALARSGGELLETLDAFFASGGVLESTARGLFVHPNTVRYRLRRIAEVTGFAPLIPRDSFALRIALTIGRLDPSAPTPTLGPSIPPPAAAG